MKNSEIDLSDINPRLSESILLDSHSPRKDKHNFPTAAHSNLLVSTQFKEKLQQAHECTGLTSFQETIQIQPFEEEDSFLLLSPESKISDFPRNEDNSSNQKNREKLLQSLLFDDMASQRDSLCISAIEETMLLERTCSCQIPILKEFQASSSALKKRLGKVSTQEILTYIFKERRPYFMQEMKQKFRRFLISKQITFKHQQIDTIIEQLFVINHLIQNGKVMKCCHHRFAQYFSTFTYPQNSNILRQAWIRLGFVEIDIDEFVKFVLTASSRKYHQPFRSALDSMDCGRVLTYWDLLLFYHTKECKFIAKLLNKLLSL